MLPTGRFKPKSPTPQIEFCPTVVCGWVAQKGVCVGWREGCVHMGVCMCVLDSDREKKRENFEL